MNLFYISPLLFILFFIFYNLEIDIGIEKPEIFITIASFLFAIFTGFFIARQNQRHVDIRQQIGENDGNFTNIYRLMGQVSEKAQKEAGKIIKSHYTKILDTKDWAFHLKRRSTTIIDLNNLLKKQIGNKKLFSLKHLSLTYIIASLSTLQSTRKKLIAFYQERMTWMQWALIIVLTVILLVSIAFIRNASFYVPILKAFFALIILIVVIYIYRLNNLTLFRDAFGLQSSRDVVEIIQGKK